MAEAAAPLVAAGKVRMLAVTMGEDGAVLVHPGGVLTHPGIKAVAHSTTGAGDSFVGGLVHGLIAGESLDRAFLRAIASGTAAVLHPGTELCRIEDVERLLEELGG